MTNHRQPSKFSNIKLAITLGLLLLFALTFLWFSLSEERYQLPEQEQNATKISVEAFFSGYDAILEELNTPAEEPPTLSENAITFSLDASGTAYFSEDCLLEMNAITEGTIYYTTDGTLPSRETGTRYQAPLELTADDPLAVYHYAAVVLYADGTYSDVCYRTYFIGSNIFEKLNILVFSVDADEEGLWSAATGIFHTNNINNRGKEWERPMQVQLFETDGSEVFNMPAGIRLYGAYSRTMVQKPMRFIARPEYDRILDDFNTMDLFGAMYDSQGVRIDRFEDLILRNAGNDFGTAFMRDELVQTLMAQQGFVFTEPVRPCMVFVNGIMYGLYWIHEPYKENYFENRFGYLNYQGEFVVLDGPERNKYSDGNEHDGFDPLADYKEMLSLVELLDMDDDNDYAILCEYLDVDSYLRLNASMVYVDNGDWPQNNNRVFKYFAAEGEDFSDVYGMDGKWYFVPHDTDWAFFNDVNTNTLTRYYDESAIQYSPLFCALMQRDDCQQTYITYLLDMMNDAYHPDAMTQTIQEIADTITTALELYLELSPYQASNFDMAAFERRYGRIITYAQNRAAVMYEDLQEVYGLGTPYTLHVDVPDGAGVNVNTIQRQGDFSGVYYSYYATALSPILPLGYEFDHWEMRGVCYDSPYLFVRKTDAINGVAKVKLVLREQEQLRITTVSYNAGEDYIVLYNPTSSPCLS